MMEGEGGAQSAGGRSEGDGNRRLVYSISTDVSVTRYPHTSWHNIILRQIVSQSLTAVGGRALE